MLVSGSKDHLGLPQVHNPQVDLKILDIWNSQQNLLASLQQLHLFGISSDIKSVQQTHTYISQIL